MLVDEEGGGEEFLHGRHDGGVEQADRILALAEQFLQAVAGIAEVAADDAVAQLENDPVAGFRHEQADVFQADHAAFGTEINVDLVEFIGDLARVGSDKSGKTLEGLRFELQLALARAVRGGVSCRLIFVVARPGWFITKRDATQLGQRFVKDTALVRTDGADQHACARRQPAGEKGLQSFQSGQDRLAPSELGVGEEIDILKPDQFFRGEEAGHAERKNGLVDDGGGVVGVVRVGVNRFQAEVAAAGRGQLGGQFAGAGLDRVVIVAGHEVEGGIGRGGGAGGHGQEGRREELRFLAA